MEMGTNIVQLAKKTAEIAADADRIASDFEKDILRSSPDLYEVYFRFNVDQGLGDIGLDEWERLALIRQRTRTYLDGRIRDLSICMLKLAAGKTIPSTESKSNDQ